MENQDIDTGIDRIVKKIEARFSKWSDKSKRFYLRTEAGRLELLSTNKLEKLSDFIIKKYTDLKKDYGLYNFLTGQGNPYLLSFRRCEEYLSYISEECLKIIKRRAEQEDLK